MDITSFLNQNGSLPISIAGSTKKADNEVVGIGGFYMYASLENTKDLSSTAPDVVLEDGSIVSDTIFLDPVVITISGTVSDIFVNQEANGGLFSPQDIIIGTISQYLPNRTNSQLSKIRAISEDISNIKRRINSAISDGMKLYDLFGDKTGSKTLQEQFLDAIEQVHFSKALIDIETPFRVYKSMRITSTRTTINNESDEVKFYIDAKQLRLRKLKTVAVTGYSSASGKAKTTPAPKASTGLGGATDAVSDKGTTSGKAVSKEKEKSLLSSILG